LIEPTKNIIEDIARNKITKNIYPPIFFIILNRDFDLLTPFL